MEAKPPVAIVVDSAGSLPNLQTRQPQLHIVPMRVTISGKTHLDGKDLAPVDFYRMLRESPALPSTSAPSPASFLEAFQRAADEAQSVLCLTVASRFSSSFDSATVAAQEASGSIPGLDVSVLDTESAAGSQGLIALEAWRAARRSESLDQVTTRARYVMQRVRLLAFVDTLYYLWKGGRVPGIAHASNSLLRIKPLFELAQGDIRTIARPRTHVRAMRRLLDLMRLRTGQGRVHATVMHADSAVAAEELRKQVEAEFPCEELFVSEFTPVMGAHIGPGLLGIAFWSRDSKGS